MGQIFGEGRTWEKGGRGGEIWKLTRSLVSSPEEWKSDNAGEDFPIASRTVRSKIALVSSDADIDTK